MRRAALYVQGRIVLGDSHLDAFQKLSQIEQEESMASGWFDDTTEEFESDLPEDHFYNKELLFVRHGECEEPQEPDSDLSDFGKEEVRKLANVLLRSFDLKNLTGICSPMLRCLETALILHELLDVPFKVQSDIIETPLFLDEGQQYRLQNHCDKFPQFNWDDMREQVLTKETLPEFLARTKIALQHFPHRCIVVAHYGFIYNATCLALCDTKAVQDIPPASVTHIDKQNVRCVGWTTN